MVKIGTIKTAQELGLVGSVERIWLSCENCGKERWGIYHEGNVPKRFCQPCSQKLGNKHKRLRGNYSYTPRDTATCSICNIGYPTTTQYFVSSKINKSGLRLSCCRKCLNRVHHQKERATLQGRLSRKISNDIRQALNGAKGYRSWETLIGYKVKDLIKHLQKQFVKGMAWDNYGEWHIDHIIPQSAFHYTSSDDIDFKRCWALENLQPLWGIDNVLKGSKILKPFQPSLKLENKNTKGTHSIVLRHYGNNLGVLERK